MEFKKFRKKHNSKLFVKIYGYLKKILEKTPTDLKCLPNEWYLSTNNVFAFYSSWQCEEEVL